MVDGLRALRKFQIGRESTPGTAVPATEALPYSDRTFRPADETWFTPVQDRGILALRVEAPFVVSKVTEFDLNGELSDRHAVWFFAMCVRGNVTPTQPDAANEPNLYQWDFAPSITSPNTPDAINGIDTCTGEFGDNVQGYESEYLFLRELVITGVVDEPVTFSATFMGRQNTEVTITGSLTEQTYAYFAANKAQLFIESDSFANIGTTAKNGLMRAFTWKFEPMFTPIYSADGAFVFNRLTESPKTVNLEMTYYRDDTLEQAEYDAYEAQSMRYIRIAINGDGEIDSGQDNPPYIWLDGSFRYTEYPEYDDEDGASVVTVVLEAFNDSTQANFMRVSVGTAMSAYPS
ncbi:MAG: hypothetical protein AAF126_03050 [Chloroflexota bacterium]